MMYTMSANDIHDYVSTLEQDYLKAKAELSDLRELSEELTRQVEFLRDSRNDMIEQSADLENIISTLRRQNQSLMQDNIDLD